MNTTKSKSRKVAWVVLGVLVLGAAISLASAWDVIWLEVAYIPDGPPVQISDQRATIYTFESPTERIKIRDLLLSCQAFPPNTRSAQVYSLRFGWLPGPRLLCVYYDVSRTEVFRLPVPELSRL